GGIAVERGVRRAGSSQVPVVGKAVDGAAVDEEHRDSRGLGCSTASQRVQNPPQRRRIVLEPQGAADFGKGVESALLRLNRRGGAGEVRETVRGDAATIF